jgi:S1-C subfamily serine protease
MSVDTPTEPERSLTLRREALLPAERSRGLGTVAVVCTMAGVASGLALATTLMAMQVADSMQTRTCPYRVVTTDVARLDVAPEHGFLGIRYVFRDGIAEIDSVLPGTPAERIKLRPGDYVVSIDGQPIRAANELQQRIYGSRPGSQPSLTIQRDGVYQTVQPTLAAWPSVSY